MRCTIACLMLIWTPVLWADDAPADGARARLLKEFDANGDGQLDDAEKAKLRERFGDRAKQGKGAAGRPGGAGQQVDREALLKKFDANGDGQLDEGERAKLREAMPQLMRGRAKGGPNGQAGGLDRAAMLKQFDANGDGQLDENERAQLREAMANRPNRPNGDPAAMLDRLPPQAKVRLLQQFDANNNGQLDPAELAKVQQMMRQRMGQRGGPGAQPLAPGEPAKPTLDRTQLLQKYDTDGDGKLSGEERAKAQRELRAK